MTTATATATATSPRRRDARATTTDEALMVRIAAGDTDAFEELYRRHAQRVLLQARKYCATRELAEEVTQEAFISLWRGAHAYRAARGSVGAWISTMARNRAIDIWRRGAARPVEVEADTLDYGRGQLISAIDAGTGAPERERELVLSLIAELPTAQKEAVFLAYFADMTQSEIAAVADAPLGTVKGRIRLGLKKLRYGFDEQSRDPRAQPPPSWPAPRRMAHRPAA